MTLSASMRIVFLFAVVAGLALLAMPAIAQSPTTPDANTTQQAPPQPSGDQNSASNQKTFTGKIVKNGDQFVLSDAQDKMTYQLDDQRQAEKYLNKNVKVTGVLDSATGTIRVSSIDAA